MASKDILFTLYQKLYEQKAVLTAAPPLTMEINHYTPQSYPEPLAEKECTAVVSYLCGVPDINEIDVNDVLNIVKKNYENHPFWKNVILDFLEYKLKQQEEKLFKQNIDLLNESNRVLEDIRREEHRQKELIKQFGDQVAKEGFHIDAYRLIKTYFSMYRQDPKKAYETLISNPAYFSHIITTDKDDNILLTPTEAIEENKKLASFLKKLKI
ncbi:MAG: hypothetical protein IJY58_00690 [Alphaproteobacteria bacterium]|nr:hypothetical protein [Alphaproteobacteria bacterium]